MLLSYIVIVLLVCWWLWTRSHPRTEDTAVILELTRRVNRLIGYMVQRYPHMPSTQLLRSRWRTANIRAAATPDPNNVAYTVGKHAITICTEGGIDSAMYVLLHELSHFSTVDVDNHSKEFWDHLDFLVKAATRAGVYTPIAQGTPFCGRSLYP